MASNLGVSSLTVRAGPELPLFIRKPLGFGSLRPLLLILGPASGLLGLLVINHPGSRE